MKISQNGFPKDMVDFKEYELENGLRVILSEDSSIPSLVINLCFHVGSKDEEPDKTGYAHLFEHLMFEGSKNIPQVIMTGYQSLPEARTMLTPTKIKQIIILYSPLTSLNSSLWMESNRMLEFAVSEESLETQKEVVIEEKKQTFDNRPYGTVSLEFAPKLFPD